MGKPKCAMQLSFRDCLKVDGGESMNAEVKILRQEPDVLRRGQAGTLDDQVRKKDLVLDSPHQQLDMHRQIEQAHQEWMAALDVVTSPIFLHDSDFRIMRCNLAYQRHAGLPYSQIIGQPYYEIFPKLEGPLKNCLAAIRHQQEMEGVEEFMSGGAIYLSRARAVKDSKGVYLFSVHFLDDVTERKRTENLLREGEARYKRITDCVTDYLYTVIIEDGQAVETRQSAACEKVTGFSSQEFSEKPDLWLQMIVPEDRDLVLQRVRQILAGEEVPPIEHRIVRKDGTVRWVQDTIILFKDAEGSLVSYDGVIRDITESKNAEFAILRANRAYKVLSNINHAVVHAVDEMQLLRDLCKIVVDTGGYSAVWVGYKRNEGPCSVQPVAQEGMSNEEASNLFASCDIYAEDKGPVCEAVRSGRTQVVQDISGTSGNETWHGYALMRSNKATIALPLMDGVSVFGCIAIYAKGSNPFSNDEVALLEEMALDLAFGIHRLRMLGAKKIVELKVQKSLLGTIQAVATLQEMRDPYTSGHQRRVADLASAIAAEMGVSGELVRGLYLAATIHDLGKIMTPVEILNKPGRLSDAEFNIIKEHPARGYEVLKDIDFPWPVAQIVLQHHEKLDGSGYPQGLKGEVILLEARILSVADIVESMTSHRPYRPSLGVNVALQEITRCRGVTLDAVVVDACTRLFAEKNYKFDGLWHSGAD